MSQARTEYLGVRLEPELAEGIKRVAEVQERSCSSFVRLLIKQYLADASMNQDAPEKDGAEQPTTHNLELAGRVPESVA